MVTYPRYYRGGFDKVEAVGEKDVKDITPRVGTSTLWQRPVSLNVSRTVSLISLRYLQLFVVFDSQLISGRLKSHPTRVLTL